MEINETLDKIIPEITEMLIQTQFQHWVESPQNLTAEEAKNRNQRAINYYRGESISPFISMDQAGFHGLVNFQMSYIMKVIKDEFQNY